MQKSKIITFIGFSIKARKVKFGVNAVKTLKGNVPLLIICHTASKNTVDECVGIAKKMSAKLIVSCAYPLEEVVSKPNCKLIAVTDVNLAKAVLDNLDSCFTEYSGGYDN